MIRWNDWYVTIKNYQIDEIWIWCNGDYAYCDFDRLQGTPIWDKLQSILTWIHKYRSDFEFTKIMDEETFKLFKEKRNIRNY
jgi:hypothetical protein